MMLSSSMRLLRLSTSSHVDKLLSHPRSLRALSRYCHGHGNRHHSYHTSHRLLAPFHFKLHDIGEGITEVEIIKWHVEPGAKVEEFDNLCEVQSDKSVVEITSPCSGTVTAVNAQVGATVRVGQTLCDINTTEDENTGDSSPEMAKVAGHPSEQSKVTNESVSEHEAPLATASPIYPSTPPPVKPASSHPLSSQQEYHSPSAPDTSVQLEGEASILPAPPQSIQPNHDQVLERQGSSPSRKDIVKTSPAVRALASKLGVVLDKVIPTGPGGRVTKDDILNAASLKESTNHRSAEKVTPRSIIQQSSKVLDVKQSVTTVPMGRTRKVMYRAMTEMGPVPHFGYSHTLNLTSLLPYLKSSPNSTKLYRAADIPDELAQTVGEPEKVTILTLLVKTLLLALEEHPIMRSRAKENHLEISRHAFIGIAVSDAKRGLLTPSLPSISAWTPVSDIAQHLLTLRSNPTAPSPPPHLTVSSIGPLGEGADAQPVLPPGGGASICAIGRARWEIEPIVRDRGVNGESVWSLTPEQVLAAGTRAVLKCSVGWSGDHRLLEGAELIAFTETWKKLVEDPSRWVQT